MSGTIRKQLIFLIGFTLLSVITVALVKNVRSQEPATQNTSSDDSEAIRRGGLREAARIRVHYVGIAAPILLSYTETLAQKNKVTNQEPTVESSVSESNDAKRQAKGRRYDKAKSGPIVELPSDGDELPLNSHWFMGMPALPIAQSDVILIGDVLNGTAHLSNSRSTVYSEFSVYTDDVLKNSSGPQSLNAGATIIVERLGGAVKFPSGKVQHYRVSRQGLPQTGEKYVLFLKCNGEGYDIVTGYWINAGQISPLDGYGGLPFSKYEGKTVDSFLSELRNAIDTSLAKGAGVK